MNLRLLEVRRAELHNAVRSSKKIAILACSTVAGTILGVMFLQMGAWYKGAFTGASIGFFLPFAFISY